MPNPPEVDRAAAARAAVAARRARAELKARVRAGELSPVSVLDQARLNPAGPSGSLRVSDFLRSIPAIGQTKAERIMEQLHIAHVKRLGGLGVRQIAALEHWLDDWERHRERTRGSRRPAGAQRLASRLLVLAGPTAVGKGTVASYIRQHHPEVQLSVSATTRAPRPGEVDGEHYFFVSDEEFDRLIEAGELLEWATVHNSHRYGTPRGPVEDALRRGKSVLLEIDIQGARSVRQAMPEAFLVFLQPPSWDELVRRLIGRGTESPAEQERRLQTAKVELAAADEFDAQVVNRDVAEAAQNIVDLMIGSSSA